ncbi:hypothetical protein [Prosthecobacter debontii]|uniref:hypothetical protein n=1 Tax=Prosthecobacter debontii TaxID=48467 RepID=UPI00099A9FD4|nr:hypothetical protein [Prosthecobacter debontii]
MTLEQAEGLAKLSSDVDSTMLKISSAAASKGLHALEVKAAKGKITLPTGGFSRLSLDAD